METGPCHYVKNLPLYELMTRILSHFCKERTRNSAVSLNVARRGILLRPHPRVLLSCSIDPGDSPCGQVQRRSPSPQCSILLWPVTSSGGSDDTPPQGLEGDIVT